MRARKRDTSALAAGSAVNGLLAYLVFALTTRALGVEAAAPVAVLWTYWSFAGAAFTFPIQHWIVRAATADGEGSVRRSLPGLFLVVAVAALVLAGLAWLARGPLFHRDDIWFPALVAMVTLGSALSGVLRGGLSAKSRFIGLAWSLGAENAVRCVAVTVLAFAGARSPVGFGLCLVAGHAVAAMWPSAFRFGADPASVTTRAPLGFLSSTATAQLLSQVTLTGGPVLLALAGGSPAEVTALFAALALFRAPYILALGVVSQMTARVTRLVIAGQRTALRRMLGILVGATAVTVVSASAVAAWLAPATLKLVFGDEVDFGSSQSAVVAAACTLAVANLIVMISALAHNRPGGVAFSWVTALLVAVLGFVAMTTMPLIERTVWSFLGAEVVAFLTLLTTEARKAGSTV